MREIVHIQAGQCGNQIGAKVRHFLLQLDSDEPLQPPFKLRNSK